MAPEAPPLEPHQSDRRSFHRRSQRKLLLTALLAGALLSTCLAGCESTAPEENGNEHPPILEPPEDPTETVPPERICPVTGTQVTEEAAVTYVHRGKLYYFASQEALKAFLADPSKYGAP